jgi:tetratricopeptide (TPR) repeat protein
MNQSEQEALQLCELGLQEMWRGDAAAALELYERAFAVVAHEETADETHELITIRKAEALIALGREGAEIGALPGIVMRRRSPRHVYLAANTLQRHLCESDQRTRAIFYGGIARRAADELGDPLSRVSVLNHLGVTLVADSQFTPAVEALEEALMVLESMEAGELRHSLTAAVQANLGGAKVLCGDAAGGVRLLETALPDLEDSYDRAEAFLDLCFGSMELGDNEAAESYGRAALRLASVPRQVRNANHLLGEICVRTERYDEADALFDVVASFYPNFRNVKQLLVAVDVCSVVNWKA